MNIVALADRPKSVRNSFVIGRIRIVFVSFHLCVVFRSGVFVIRLRQISSLFSTTQNRKVCNMEIEIVTFVVKVSAKLTSLPIDKSKSKYGAQVLFSVESY